jgi:membrane-bound serine protease (ClpP class)
MSGGALMIRVVTLSRAFLLLAGLLVAIGLRASEPGAPAVAAPSSAVAPESTPALVASPAVVYVIPVREQIAQPVAYVIRRGLKEATERKADLVVLDMNTPGGALDATFEIMEALDKFSGRTATYVNDEAISAGAFISAVTDEIWFAPRGKIGAAAPVMAGGAEINASMKEKIVSFLKAEVRSVSEGKGYRGQVVSAMIDVDEELKIGETVIKPKGKLLTLTASEAMKTYGDPPQPLLGAGVAETVTDLLKSKYGENGFTVRTLEVTWSEHAAQYLTEWSPILLGLGLVALFIEFKTPGFGVFGVSGILLLLVVFFGHYVAGFSGHEPVLVFALGLVLIALELFLFPGILVLALSGLALMLGALVWSMADLWPNEPITFSGGAFVEPIKNLVLGLLIAVAGVVAVLRFMPRSWLWDRMILATSVGGGAVAVPPASADPLIGRRGVAVSALRPSGQVEVDGERHEARIEVGALERGAAIRVVGREGFGLRVEEDHS